MTAHLLFVSLGMGLSALQAPNAGALQVSLTRPLFPDRHPTNQVRTILRSNIGRSPTRKGPFLESFSPPERATDFQPQPPFLLAKELRVQSKSGLDLSHVERDDESLRSADSGSANDDATESSSYVKPALFVGSALITTGALILTDQTTYNILHRWRTYSDPIEDTSPIITNLGDGRASAAIFGGFLAYSYLANDNTAYEAGTIGFESFLASGIVTQVLKHVFGRQRPSTATQTGGRWNGSYFLLNQGAGKRGGYASFDAFPSGHTATIFAAATTLAEVYHNSPWVSYVSYSVAGGVAISRVMERAHWLSDCFVGGIIGYFSTQVVLHLNHLKGEATVQPMYDGQSTGLALSVTF